MRSETPERIGDKRSSSSHDEVSGLFIPLIVTSKFKVRHIEKLFL